MLGRKTHDFASILSGVPWAVAQIQGSGGWRQIRGSVSFFKAPSGVLVCAEIFGLENQGPILSLHIHEGGSCTGNASDPFFNAGAHYNPSAASHPYHAGDLPPLFNAGGMAYSVVLTNRFEINQIIGKTVIIHSNRDDFTSQPSGDAGKKIACGIIFATRRSRLS